LLLLPAHRLMDKAVAPTRSKLSEYFKEDSKSWNLKIKR
jgi:hypothetical protein